MSVLCIGIDDGHRQVKAFSLDTPVQEVIFSSRASVSAAVMMNDLHHSQSGAFEADGQFYVISENLQEFKDTRFAGYPLSDLNRVFITHALIRAGVRGSDEVILCTGLPLVDYYAGGKKNTSLIEQKTQNILGINKKPLKNMDGDELPSIIRHVVAPEGFAAWMAYSKEQNIAPSRAPRMVAIIDIGGRTTDVFVFSPRDMRVVYERTGSIEIGISKVYDEMIRLIRQSHNIVASESWCDDVLRTMNSDTIPILGRRPFPEGKQIARDSLLLIGRMLKDQVEQKIGAVNSMLESVLVVGGGASLLSPYLGMDGLTTPEQGEMLNARGMYYAAKSTHKE